MFPVNNFHKDITDTSKNAKVLIFFEPLVAVMDMAPDGSTELYRRVHI